MNKNSRGYAIPLLLWMIAGMSLMVAAVIHFAQDDIGMAELQVNEARAHAMARGLALLASRDNALEAYLSPELRGGEDNTAVRSSGDSPPISGSGDTGLFRKEYRLNEIASVATVYPANAFISLNSGTEEEIFRLLTSLGGAKTSEGGLIVQGIMDYRNQLSSASSEMDSFSGFRYREELLAVEGMKRSVYDGIKDYVHPHVISGLDVARSPEPLRTLFHDHEGDSADFLRPDVTNDDRPASSSSMPLVEGELTFESMYRQKAAMRFSAGVRAVVVDLSLENGFRSRQRIWLSGTGNAVLRSETLTSKRSWD